MSAPLIGAERPNIVVLLADDLGWSDLSCYGSRHTHTPNLDRLAEEGMRFTDFYAAAPNCSPSRAGLLTGRVPARTGIYNYIPDQGPLYLPTSEVTVAELLKDAGYDTAHFGKWHLNYNVESKEIPQPADHGFNYSLRTENNAMPSHRNPKNFVRNDQRLGEVEGFSCQIVVDEAINWIENLRDRESPFFTCLWFHETHTPIASPDELVESHRNAGRKKKEAQYNANVENLDIAIGRFLRQLDSLKLSDNTLVVFSSDNGGLAERSNGPLRGRKSFVWEGGIREPGIMRWPGHIPAGVENNTPCGLVDLLPTFCTLAECRVPDDRPIDGVDLVPIWNGESIRRSYPLFWFFYRVEPAAAMRDGDWTIVGYLAGKVPKSHPLSPEQMAWLKRTGFERFELYNVRVDIGEQSDLSSRHPHRFAAMSEAIIERHKAVVSEGPVWQFPPKKSSEN